MPARARTKPQPRGADRANPTRAKQRKAKGLSNPASTGGAGSHYENRVQASRLLAMCLGTPIPGKSEGNLLELKFQARIDEYQTDDLVCTWQDRVGNQSRLLVQVKRAPEPLPSNHSFSEAVGGAWLDFNSDERFTRGVDSIFIIYDEASSSAMLPMAHVCEWARYSADSEEFHKKIAEAGFSSENKRKALRAIYQVVQEYVGQRPSSAEVYEFLKHLYCYPQALDRDGTADHVGYLTQIRQAAQRSGASVNEEQVWAKLVEICATLNKNAATVTLENLSKILGSELTRLFLPARQSSQSSLNTIVGCDYSRGGEQNLNAQLANLSRIGAQVEQKILPAAEAPSIPAARADSLNKLVTNQLDAINQQLKMLHFRDAAVALESLGVDQTQFDNHQRARWMLMRGTCRWHLESASAAANDFIAAAQLYSGDDKLAAALVRGLLLKGDVRQALIEAERARTNFPNSLSVWLAYVHAFSENGGVVQVEDIPYEHRDSAEALQVVAWTYRAQENKLNDAVKVAMAALQKGGVTLFSRELALALVLERIAGSSFIAVFRMLRRHERKMLSEVINEFNPRGERIWSAQTPEHLAAVVYNLTVAYLLLNENEEALRLLAEARSHGVAPLSVRRLELEALHAMGRGEEAVRIGVAALPNLSKEAIATLGQFAAECSNIEAVDAAIAGACALGPPEPGLLAMLTALRWDALYRTDRVAGFDLVRSAVQQGGLDTPELCVATRIWLQEDPSGANVLIEEAEARLASTTDVGHRYMLGQLFVAARRHASAATAYEGILPEGVHSHLHNELLFSYIRAGRRAKARDLIKTFPPGWSQNSAARRLALELAYAASDWAFLSTLVDAQLAEDGAAAENWLFKIQVVSRLDPAGVAAIVAAIPERLTGNARTIAEVAKYELKYERKESAMRHLYAMYRTNLGNLEAASSYIFAIIGAGGELPLMDGALEFVSDGTSVTLLGEGGNASTIVIDPAGVGELSSVPGFFHADAESARLLIGKRAGDEVSVSGGLGGVRTYAVGAVKSAYLRLLEMAYEAHQAPIEPTVHLRPVVIPKRADGSPDFSPIVEELERAGAQSKKVFGLYGDAPLTVGGMAKLLGTSVMRLFREWPRDAHPLQVSSGNSSERKAALGILEGAENEYVIGMAALTELAIGNSLAVLGQLPRVFVPALTWDMLQAELADARDGRSSGQAVLVDGKLCYRAFSDEGQAKDVAFVERILQAIAEHCVVSPVYGRDEVVAISHKIERAVSEEEHEMLLLCAEKRAVLFSADMRLSSFARGLMDVPSVWPQSVLEVARLRGFTSQRDYSYATAMWFLSNRGFISVSALDLAAISYYGTRWLNSGLCAFERQIMEEKTDFDSVAGVSLGFLLELAKGTCHFGATLEVLRRLSEALHRHPGRPPEWTDTFSERARQVFASTRVQAWRIERAVREGAQAARGALLIGERPSLGVEVVMCGAPPWIAYRPHKAGVLRSEWQVEVHETPASEDSGNGEASTSAQR